MILDVYKRQNCNNLAKKASKTLTYEWPAAFAGSCPQCRVQVCQSSLHGHGADAVDSSGGRVPKSTVLPVQGERASQAEVMRILARGIHVLWQQQTNSHGLWKFCGENSQRLHGHSLRERALTPTRTGFYCFSRHITSRMALIYYAQVQFTLGGYLLQKTKERMLLNKSKKKDICKCKGKSGRTGYTPYLGSLAQILGS